MTDKPIQLFENKYQCCGCNACEMVYTLVMLSPYKEAVEDYLHYVD